MVKTGVWTVYYGSFARNRSPFLKAWLEDVKLPEEPVSPQCQICGLDGMENSEVEEENINSLGKRQKGLSVVEIRDI